MRKLSIDVTKIPPGKTKPGKPAKDGHIPRYLDLVEHDNREGKDQWGWDGFVALDVTKEERLAGVRGVIIGNWKEIGGGNPPQPSAPARAPQAAAHADEPLDDIPF